LAWATQRRDLSQRSDPRPRRGRRDGRGADELWTAP